MSLQPETNHATLENENTTTTLPTEKNTREHPLMEILRFSLIALLIVVPIRMFIAQPFIVSGASMEETFHSGEYLIVDQASYYFQSPKRGDVVIFRYPRDPSKFFIKRVIGIPGDTVTITDNTVHISNEEFPEGYVLEESYITSMHQRTTITEELGAGEYFVMGDNRDQSSDSRAWGVLEEDKIVGRALLRLFPPQSFEYMPGALDKVSITQNP
ncbi:MAG: signal peptidase I [Candidatus Paceibacteria bacterium]